MKKLMTLLSAATVAIGLYATDTGTSFEGVSRGTFEFATAADDIGNENGYWGANESVVLTVKEGESCVRMGNTGNYPDQFNGNIEGMMETSQSNYLHIASTFGNPLTRYVDNNNHAAGELLEDNNPFYFDSLVKFTAFEDDPLTTAVTNDLNGAKIAVWIQTNADETQTNLYVRAGKLGDEAQSYDCGAFSGADAWHRLTIKAIRNIYASGATEVPGFVVFIDNGVVGSNTDKGIDKAKLRGDCVGFDTDEALFPSMDQTADGRYIVSTSFDGQGDIDDVVFTRRAPFAAAAPADAKATYNGKTYDNLADAIRDANAATDDDVELKLFGTQGDEVLEIDNPNARVKIDLNGQTIEAIDAGNSPVWVVDSLGGAKVTGSCAFTDGSLIQGGAYVGNASELNPYTDDTHEFVDGTGDFDGYLVLQELPWVSVLGAPVDGAYTIDDLADLKAFQQGVAAGKPTAGLTFKLTDNITLDAAWPGIGIQNGKDIVSTEEFNAGAFCGTFDGQNYTISNFQMVGKDDNPANEGKAQADWEGLDYAGFFNSTYDAEIRNLKIQYAGALFAVDTTASSKESGATFVGVAKNSTLQNLTSLQKDASTGVSCSKGFGGIVGYTTEGTTVESCTNNVNMTSLANNKCGGIAMIRQSGTGSATIRNCQNNGTLTTGSSNGEFGGIVGYIGDDITIDGCESTVAYKLFHRQQRKSGDVPVVTMSGVNKGNATVLAYTSVPDTALVSGLNFATVDGNVATFVADNALALNGSYKVMAAGATATFAFAEAGTIAFDTALATPTFAVTAGSGLEVSDSTSGTVKTYTAVAQYTITYTDSDGSAFTDWADNYAAPTTFTASRIATLPTTSDVNIDRVSVEFAGWTNAVGTVITTTEGLSANLEVFAKFNAVVPVTPTIDPANPAPVEITAESAEAAEAAVQLTTPTGVDAADYKALFDIVATETSAGSGVYSVEVTGIKDSVVENVDKSAMDVLDQKLGATVRVPAGLYYKVTTYTTLGGAAVQTESGMSNGSGVSVGKPGTAQGFIKIEMAPTAIN